MSHYILEKKIGTGNFGILVEIPSNYMSYVDTNITFGKTYQYRLTGVFESGFKETALTDSLLVPLEIIKK